MNNGISPLDIMESAEEYELRNFHKKQELSSCPPFPVEIFPKEMQNIASAYQKYESFNLDYFCGSMLSVFSAAMGNQWAAHFTASWYAAPIIYIVLVGPASCGKTPPLRQAIAPLQRIDSANDIDYNARIKDYDRAMGISREERLSHGYEEFPEKPQHKCTVVINTTIESLFSILDQNRRGVLMFVDELDSLIANFSRYNRGSDEAYWLELFNGSQIKYMRKGSGEYINILHPYVSIIGGTQPGMLSQMFGEKRTVNGFSSRFLKIYPDIQEIPLWHRSCMPEQYITQWNDIITQVMSFKEKYDDNGDVIPMVLDFSPDALDRLFEWKKNNNQVWEEAEDDYTKSVCGKLETYNVSSG